MADMDAVSYSLAAAQEAYWHAETPAQERQAYHQILLFGGNDGYRSGWRPALARLLRRIALAVEY